MEFSSNCNENLGYKVAYFSMPKLLQKLQFARADGDRRSARLSRNWLSWKINLLILDDWGDRRSACKSLKLLLNFHYYNSLRIDMVEIQRLLLRNYQWRSGLTISMNPHLPMPLWIDSCSRCIA